MVYSFLKTIMLRPIGWILLAGLALRLLGVTYALPQFFVNDERANVYGALKMMELKTLVPVWHEEEFKKVLNYLPLPSYIYLVVLVPVLGLDYLLSGAASILAWRNQLVLDPTIIFLTARAMVALMGSATIYLVYRLARKLFSSERAGLLAALFLTFSFYHVQLSHVTRQWMPALFFLSLAWLAAAELYQGGKKRWYLLAGLFTGLGVGANTAAAVAIIPPFLAHFFRPGPDGFWQKIRDAKLVSMVAIAILVSLLFIALYPYGLTQGEAREATAGSTLVGKFSGLAEKRVGEWLGFLLFYFKLLVMYEPTLFVAAIAGAAAMAGRHRRWLFVGVIFSIGYLSLLYLFFNIIPRGILFILPPLAAIAGYGADRVLLWLQQKIPPTMLSAAIFFSFAFLFLFGWPFALALRYDYLLSQPDTRILAARWVYQNIPAEEKILADLEYLRLTNTKAGINELKGIDPAGLRVQDQTLLLLDDARYPKPSRTILNLHFVSPGLPYRLVRDKNFFTAQGYRFFLVAYEYGSKRDLDPQSRALMAQGKLIQRFDDALLPASGRALDISGEISGIAPWELWQIKRFGQIVEAYQL